MDWGSLFAPAVNEENAARSALRGGLAVNVIEC